MPVRPPALIVRLIADPPLKGAFVKFMHALFGLYVYASP